MSISLDGKVIVVIGGTTGIGLSAAKAFIEAGAKVVAVGRNMTGGRPEWGPGDPGPNRFGPPPE